MEINNLFFMSQDLKVSSLEKQVKQFQTILSLMFNFERYKVSKISDLGRGWPEGSLFNSNYTEV